MKKKHYTQLSKVFLLLIIFFPAIIFAQVTLDKQGKLPVTMRFQEGSQPTVSSFFQDFRQTYPLSEENQMKELRKSTDKTGTHYRFDQFYKGVQVIGAQFILHEINGSIWYANGRLVSGLDMDVKPLISQEEALKFALNDVNANNYMWENPQNEAFIKIEQNNENATFYPKAELKLTSGNDEIISKNIKLVYRFDIYAQQPLGRYWVDVDAKTGEIVNKLNRIHTDDVPGSGESLYNGNVAMTVDEYVPATTFRLEENTTREAVIKTFDLQNTWGDYPNAVDFESTSADGPWDETGVSAHYGAEATYDYFYNEHGRNSLDDAGFNLLSYVHYGVDYVNAFWDGSRMTYGDGDGVDYFPLVSLDVVGHELTHGVTEFSSNLIYAGESGGLNESFSDIFGNLVEFYIEGYDYEIWRVGEDFSNGLGFRNMADPNEFNNPDTYFGDYWFDEVHNTSGVQNFWFYLLSEGGSGTNDNGDAYDVTGIGLDDAALIAYLNNNSYLIPSSDFQDARTQSIAAAESLFGAGSQQAISVADAWDAVGVYYYPPPSNDLCEDAIALASCNEFVFGTTWGALLDIEIPFCDFGHTAGGVWYTVVGNGANITASLCSGTYFDSRLSIYEGGCDAPTCVAVDDDGCGSFGASEVTWLSTVGTQYFILVHANGTFKGDFELTISSNTSTISASPDVFSFTVPLNGSDSDQLTISNLGGDDCASDLDWNISSTVPVLPETSYEIRKQIELNNKSNSKQPEKIYLISEQTINSLSEQGFFEKYSIQNQLVSIQDQPFYNKNEYYAGVSNAIGIENELLLDQISSFVEIRPSNPGMEGLAFNNKSQVQLIPNGQPVFISGSDNPSDSEGGAMQLTDGDVTITHSLDQSLDNNSTIACFNGSYTLENHYFRTFTLTDFGIDGDFDVTEVEIGIGVAYDLSGDGVQPLTVKLYTSDGGTFPTGTLIEIGSATYDIPDQQLTMITLPVSGLAPANSELVVEIYSPSGNLFWIGANSLGQTAPGYFLAPDCGFNEPVDLETIWPMHIVMNVTGSTSTPCPWLTASPSSGSIAIGNSDEVTVNVDAAGMEPGTYECQLTIFNNSANNSQMIIPVTMIVEDTDPVIIEVTPASMTFDVEQDGTDNGLLNIANISVPGAPDLVWSISGGSIPEATSQGNSKGNDGFIYSYTAPIDYTGYPVEAIDREASGSNITPNTIGVKYLAPSNPLILLSGNGNNWESDKEMQSSTSFSPVTITHSLSQDIISENSVSCNAGSLHTDNSYWRSFVLDDFGITNDFEITDVEIGVESAIGNGGAQSLTVNLYTTDASFPSGNLTLIGTATYDVSDQALTILNLPITTTALAGSELVVEIYTPDGQALGNSFFIGSNDAGQTDPSYISAAACGVTNPTDIAALGFSGMHIVMNVSGNTTYDLPCPWLSVTPESGTTSVGSSDDVTVSVDATGLAPGTYECQLTVSSNASNTSEVVVPITLNVINTSVATLPFIEDWESNSGTTFGNTSIYAGAGYEWAFETDIQDKGRVKWGTDTQLAHNGLGALTMDKDFPTSAVAINSTILTIDLSSYVSSTELELSFFWADHGDEEHVGDKVWIRGSTADDWIEAFDLEPMSKANNQYQFSGIIDIDELLINASTSQIVSETFQVKFGQQDNGPTPADGISFDDISIREVSYSVATLPFTEDWESNQGTTLITDHMFIESDHGWFFETDLQNKGRALWGTDAYLAHNGTGALTLDKLYPTSSYSVNSSTLTINLENYDASNDLELSFWWADHGDEENPGDKVWIRGSKTDDWVEAFDINPLSVPNHVYQYSGIIDIDMILSSASPSQVVTDFFQVKFGQEDNGPIPVDGISFDDITIGETVIPPLQPIMLADVNNLFEGNYELKNYPNPFNQSTTIQFNLEKTSHAKLTVFNSLGREVATLFDENALAGQIYKLEFNGFNLAPGIYVYHLLTSDGVNIVKKMQLIR